MCPSDRNLFMAVTCLGLIILLFLSCTASLHVGTPVAGMCERDAVSAVPY